jgi:hypothetical protein
MSDLFVASFTSYLAGQPDDNPSDGTLPNLDGVFEFVEQHDLDAPRPTGPSRQQSLSGYETPTPSDGGWLASQGMRPAITVVSSDDEQDDALAVSDTSVDSDDDTDEMGDAGVARDTTLEWKIDHSSGDHRLHGIEARERVKARLTLSSTGLHREDRIKRI